jgi:hypothetical protein
MKKPVLLFIFISYAAIAFCDDGSYYLAGNSGAVIPVKNDAIAMEKEDIKINIGIQKWDRVSADYDCMFYFANTSNKTQTALIGFPHKLNAQVSWDYTDNGRMVTTPTDTPVCDFYFYVDGKKKPFSPMPVKGNPDLKDVPAYDVIYTTEVVFEPKEKKIIRNTFRMYYFLQGYPSPDPMHIPHGFNTITYILKTGLTWKGPIGVADIRVIFDTPKDFLSFRANPDDYRIEENPEQIHYHYINFSPKSDIAVTLDYKKMSLDYSIKQVRDYISRNDYLNAYYLLLKLDARTPHTEKNRDAKDAVRMLAYKVAEHFYRIDQDKTIQLYQSALHNCYSYNPRSILDFVYPNEETKKKYDFTSWEHEKDEQAPCYYIAYNLACVYSMTGEMYQAKLWYEIALLMNDKLKAMAENDKDLEYLIKGKTDHIIKKDDGMTLLMKALKTGNPNEKEITHLIETSIDINTKDKNGMTALMHAASQSYNLKFMRAVIAAGADVNAADNEGKTALMWACIGFSPKKEKPEVLITAGAHINVQDKKGKTPIIHLLSSRVNIDAIAYKETVKYMLACGANPELRDLRGFNAYDVAAQGGNDYVFVDNYMPSLKELTDARVRISSRDPDIKFSRITDLRLDGDRLFILYKWGWIVLDLSALPDVKLIADTFIGYEHPFDNFALKGDYLYAANKEKGRIYVYETTNLVKPVEVKSFPLSDKYQSMSSMIIKDNLLCVSIDEGYISNTREKMQRLICYELKDPANPVYSHSSEIPCCVLHSFKDFLVMNCENLYLVNVSRRQNSMLVDKVDSKGKYPIYDTLYTDGNTIIVSHSGSASIYSIDKNNALIKVAELSEALGSPRKDFYINGNVIVKNVAYLRGFRCFVDISDPNNPKYFTPEAKDPSLYLDNSIVSGNYVISVDSNSDIRIYDFHNPIEPVLLKQLSRQ